MLPYENDNILLERVLNEQKINISFSSQEQTHTTFTLMGSVNNVSVPSLVLLYQFCSLNWCSYIFGPPSIPCLFSYFCRPFCTPPLFLNYPPSLHFLAYTASLKCYWVTLNNNCWMTGSYVTASFLHVYLFCLGICLFTSMLPCSYFVKGTWSFVCRKKLGLMQPN